MFFVVFLMFEKLSWPNFYLDERTSFLDGVQQGNINGTFGPETFNDHRHTFNKEN